MASQSPRRFQLGHALIAWALLGLTACSIDAPVSPTLAVSPTAPLASKLSTTISTILFYGQVPVIAGNTDDHVFSMNSDGTSVRQLTRTFSRYGSWAPDGKRILFSDLGVNDGHISVMNADGTGITVLTFPPSTCEDIRAHTLGKQVVFIRAGGACPAVGLYLMNADGTGLTLLDSSPNAGSDIAPSPKGTSVAFAKAGDLWLLDLGTHGLTNLTKSGASPSDPSFSPSGKQIAFVQGAGVWVMNVDGTGASQLSFPSADFQDISPRWSPDGGKSIAFTRFQIPREDVIASEILVMNADGTNVTDLTSQTLGAGHVVTISAWAR